MSSEKTKRRLTAIDVFIIFAVFAIVVAAGLRLYDNYSLSNETVPEEALYEEYTVSFVSKSMKESTANLLSEGEVFYLTGGKDEFGVLEKISTTPATFRLELSDGTLLTDVPADKNGNNTKTDVSGTFKVSGYRDAYGILNIAENQYLSTNMLLTVFSHNTSLTLTVTGIEKAG